MAERMKPESVPADVTVVLIRHFNRQDMAVDPMPYTARFDALCCTVQAELGRPIVSRDVFRYLVALRKGGMLQLKGKRNAVRSPLSPESKAIIGRLYAAQPITTDRLPYTQQFEAMWAAYNAESAEPFTSKALFFCAVMRLRKQTKLPLKGRRPGGPDGFDDADGAPALFGSPAA